ncbi:MAG: M50 family metallopeptidase [Patescibacteria group bacterium]
MLLTIIIFIIILSILVFAHEFGHFWTARKFGVKVEEFGFGLPPRIFGIRKFNQDQIEKMAEKETVTTETTEEQITDSAIIIKEKITDRIQEVDKVVSKNKWEMVWGSKEAEPWSPTIYSLNWIPVGGFVKIRGESGEYRDRQDSFANKAIWKKLIILAAGVTMNVILCAVLLMIGFGLGLPAVVGEQTKGQIISQAKIQIVEVLAESPAQAAGIKAGDTILSADDNKFTGIEALRDYLNNKIGQKIKFNLKRGKNEIIKEVEVKKYGDNIGIGVGLAETAIVRYPWYLAIWQGIKMTYVWLIMIVVGFATIIRNLFVGAPVGVEVAGPVGIAALTGQMARMGFIYVLQFTALLSLNLAIINILPFPALDGGRILFLIIEKIRRKAVKQQLENLIHNLGFMLLMVLIIFITYRDVVKYGAKILGAMKGLVGL